jgi:hypothetical protein
VQPFDDEDEEDMEEEEEPSTSGANAQAVWLSASWPAKTPYCASVRKQLKSRPAAVIE